MGTSGPALLDGPRKEAVHAELERILGSAPFRGSRRSREFLCYVVGYALEGKTELLKERTIGVEVFERPTAYDTGEDSIVRVKANEVRKRLAQYYQEAGAGRAVQVELPSGSYVPEFRFLDPAPDAARPAGAARRRRPWLLAAGVAAVACAAALLVWRASTPPPFDDFWRPVLASPRPVLLCVAHPPVFRMSSSFWESAGESIPRARITRDPDHFVGVGDALALAELAAFFSRAGKASHMRIGTETSFADLRNSPAVLIGAFSNQWTMRIMRDVRFVFERDGSDYYIKDQLAPGQRWMNTPGDPSSDFAIVSRVFDSKTGDLVIAAAGLSHQGTRAAGELLTHPAYLENVLRAAPPDWPKRSLQLLLKAEVIGGTPGPPKVLASHYW